MVSSVSPPRMLNLFNNDCDIVLLAYLCILPFTRSIQLFDNCNTTHTFFPLYINPVNLTGIKQVLCDIRIDMKNNEHHCIKKFKPIDDIKIF